MGMPARVLWYLRFILRQQLQQCHGQHVQECTAEPTERLDALVALQGWDKPKNAAIRTSRVQLAYPEASGNASQAAGRDAHQTAACTIHQLRPALRTTRALCTEGLCSKSMHAAARLLTWLTEKIFCKL